MLRRRFIFILMLCPMASGCEMLQWLQPHNLWKLNRQPAMGRDDAYFNVPPETTLRLDSQAAAPLDDAPLFSESR